MSLPLHRLPSLDLLRGFVAVGRRMSITLAARDLFLTQSAVSRQVQALETALGVKLLVRGYRRIAFTPDGERLFRHADGALAQLQDVLGTLKEPDPRRVVTLTAAAGITGLWLVERLGAFLAAHPDIEVRIASGTRPLDLKAEGIDLAIRYGPRESMPRGAEFLFSETVVPVAHPSLRLRALRQPQDLARVVLLDFDGPYRPWLQWSDWLACQGWDGGRPKAVLRYSEYDQLIRAAVAGQGVALGRLPLVTPMLQDGRLRPFTLPAPGPAVEHAYWLLTADTEPRPEVATVMRWIRSEAGA